MKFIVAKASAKTGALLETLVKERVKGDPTCVICYGAGYGGNLPSLNSRCSDMDKLQQAVALRKALKHQAINPLNKQGALEFEGPLLARKTNHTKGKDIRVALEKWQVHALAESADFFVPYIPSEEEYRVWAFRTHHLATYRKVLARPGDFTKVGRNYENGFTFELIDRHKVPDALKEIARRAVSVLGLDFGAVDILGTGKDYVVVEVNSGPGVQDDRRVVINKLAAKVTAWIEGGCK